MAREDSSNNTVSAQFCRQVTSAAQYSPARKDFDYRNEGERSAGNPKARHNLLRRFSPWKHTSQMMVEVDAAQRIEFLVGAIQLRLGTKVVCRIRVGKKSPVVPAHRQIALEECNSEIDCLKITKSQCGSATDGRAPTRRRKSTNGILEIAGLMLAKSVIARK